MAPHQPCQPCVLLLVVVHTCNGEQCLAGDVTGLIPARHLLDSRSLHGPGSTCSTRVPHQAGCRLQLSGASPHHVNRTYIQSHSEPVQSVFQISRGKAFQLAIAAGTEVIVQGAPRISVVQAMIRGEEEDRPSTLLASQKGYEPHKLTS